MVKSGIEDPPVFCPFLSFMIKKPVEYQLPDTSCLRFAKVDKLVGQNLSH